MKKKVVILLVVLVVTIGVCVGAYFLFTNDRNIPNVPPEPEITENNKNTLDNDTMPRVDASLATQPLMDAYVKYFANEDILTDVKNNYTNTHPAYEKLVNNETDLIVVTEPSEEELKMAHDAGVDLQLPK